MIVLVLATVVVTIVVAADLLLSILFVVVVVCLFDCFVFKLLLALYNVDIDMFVAMNDALQVS